MNEGVVHSALCTLTGIHLSRETHSGAISIELAEEEDLGVVEASSEGIPLLEAMMMNRLDVVDVGRISHNMLHRYMSTYKNHTIIGQLKRSVRERRIHRIMAGIMS
jgi:hypothetical protein